VSSPFPSGMCSTSRAISRGHGHASGMPPGERPGRCMTCTCQAQLAWDRRQWEVREADFGGRGAAGVQVNKVISGPPVVSEGWSTGVTGDEIRRPRPFVCRPRGWWGDPGQQARTGCRRLRGGGVKSGGFVSTARSQRPAERTSQARAGVPRRSPASGDPPEHRCVGNRSTSYRMCRSAAANAASKYLGTWSTGTCPDLRPPPVPVSPPA